MHLPDGLLDAETWITLGVAGAGAVAFALRKVKTNPAIDSTSLSPSAPIVGLSAAFVFAAQMVNFPVACALSGHLLGGTMLAILLGPWMGALVMTAVLFIQALFFQDGGITALGANIINLAFLSTFVGYGIYRLLLPQPKLSSSSTGWSLRQSIAVFIAAWASAVVAALAAAVELALSGMAPLPSLLTIMGGTHALIGIGEGIVSVLVLRSLVSMGLDNLPGGLSQSLGAPRHG